MVKMVEPPYAKLSMEITLNYSPKDEEIAAWHIVKDGQKENFQTIATKHGVPVAKLIEFNFPGAMQSGRINPDIVNWYLFHHKRFLCRKPTRDGFNYMFGGGEKVAIPYLGTVELGELVIVINTRKDCITKNLSTCKFVVNENLKANGAEPIYEIAAFSDVRRYSSLIDRVSSETSVDARLIRAIMYMETTHGYYDAPLSIFGQNKSILPMNINVEYWGSTFGDRKAMSDPYLNIKAGAEILRRIMSNMPAGTSVRKIATLYNNTNAHSVSDYGVRVERIYETQPWLKDEKK